MTVPFSSDEVVEKVRDITSLPDAHWIDTTKILSFADEEIESLLGARVKTAREGHWLKAEDVPFVPGTLRYRIPRRAFGRAVHSIAQVSLSSGQVLPMSDIDPALASSFTGSAAGVRTTYYVEDDEIVFPVQPPAGYAMRFRYLRRPSRLVPMSKGAPIIESDTGGIGLFVDGPNAPDWMVVRVRSGEPVHTPAPIYVDTVRGDAPFDLSYVDLKFSYYDAAANEAVFLPPTVVDVTRFVDNSVANDRADYICLRDQTVYPQLPAELFPTLVSAVARRVLEALGDRPGAEIAQASMKERAAAASAIIEPRNQDRSRPLVNKYSALRGGGRGRGRGWWPGS